MSDEKKKSPWLKDQAHPADLPEEVYNDMMESDDSRLERDMAAARLASTPLPPEPQWKQCWACGKKVPIRFRDPLYGILVCRGCVWTSALQEFLANAEGLFGGIGDFLGGGAPSPDDEIDDDDDEIDEEEGLDGVGEAEDAPTEPQATSPNVIEAAGGGAAKAEDEPEPKGEGQDEVENKPETTGGEAE
jgi:hypothetical protein